jgi:hypothetical protein
MKNYLKILAAALIAIAMIMMVSCGQSTGSDESQDDGSASEQTQEQEIETETFPWTEEGVEQIKAWLEEKLKERGTEPYRIPYPRKKNDVLEQSE